MQEITPFTPVEAGSEVISNLELQETRKNLGIDTIEPNVSAAVRAFLAGEINQNLVKVVSHPKNPDIVILNYTELCTYLKAWDEVTTACRSLIINRKTGKVLAYPLGKFFNLHELSDSEQQAFFIKIV